MRVRFVTRAILALATVCASAAVPLLAAPSALPSAARGPALVPVSLAQPLPAALTDPEGLTVWDLSELATETSAADVTGSGGSDAGRSGPGSDASLLRWMHPQRHGEPLEVGRTDRLVLAGHVIETAIVGAGRLRAAGSEHWAFLQRALVTPADPGAGPRLLHRWIDPAAGVVATVGGPASAGGAFRTSVDEASVTAGTTAASSLTKIYADDVWDLPFETISYGYDRDPGLDGSVQIADLTPEGYATMGELLAADFWDFRPTTSGTEIASTTTLPGEDWDLDGTCDETCNCTECGYDLTGVQLDRADSNWDDTGQWVRNNQLTIREDGLPHSTIWLRAGAQREGVAGGFGNQGGESRFCYDPATGRTAVPIWEFPNNDVDGWYMEPGTTWSSGAFGCEQNIFNFVCGGSGGLFGNLHSEGGDGGCTDHPGTQSGEVIKSGIVKTPSGHTFNALAAQTVADFCVYSSDAFGCTALFEVDEVRTVVTIFEVPKIGSVSVLQSPQEVNDTTSFSVLDETNVKYGLYPARTLAVKAKTANSVTVGWDPGLITHRIDGWKVYWDTDSGSASSYAFDSDGNPGQVSFGTNEATISGLMPGTHYFITLTAKSSFTYPSADDPADTITRTYESLLYPDQAFGDPSFAYPTEVEVATTGGSCNLTTGSDEATDLTAEKLNDEDVELSWIGVSDACLIGYRVYAASDASSSTFFEAKLDVPDQTAVSLPVPTPVVTFLLVVPFGDAEGVWGHFGL